MSTTTTTYLQQAEALYHMMGEGKTFDALDQFYADDVTIIEANGDTFHGKDTQRQRIVDWQNGIEEFHGGGVYSITSNEEAGVTMVESWTDASFKGSGRMKFEEVAVQYWEEGKIVRERFYYDASM